MHAGLAWQLKWEDCSQEITEVRTLGVQLQLQTIWALMQVSCPWALLAFMAVMITVVLHVQLGTRPDACSSADSGTGCSGHARASCHFESL